MAQEVFNLPGFGDITIAKRSANRTIRLSVKSNGQVMVTIPTWASYRSGLTFAESKLDWLKKQVPASRVLRDGQPVGKYHHLQLSPTRGLRMPRTLVTKTSIIVRYPYELAPTHASVQKAAEAACVRALRKQAENLLPQRLGQLAEQHDFHFNSVGVKQLTSRWGSCDQHQNIVLNLYLMQLPWDCIDYVLLHELTHTRILRHGPPFWEAMQKLIPNLSQIRKEMRTYQPVLQSSV